MPKTILAPSGTVAKTLKVYTIKFKGCILKARRKKRHQKSPANTTRLPNVEKALLIDPGIEIHVHMGEIDLSNDVLTEKDLDVDEKKVFGRIIDMWSLGSEEDPYSESTESEVIKYSKTDGLSEDQIRKVLMKLEEQNLIHRDEVNGKAYIKYNARAVHIVKELQKTAYSHSRKKFIPHH